MGLFGFFSRKRTKPQPTSLPAIETIQPQPTPKQRQAMQYLNQRYGKPRSSAVEKKMMQMEDALNAQGWMPQSDSGEWVYRPDVTRRSRASAKPTSAPRPQPRVKSRPPKLPPAIHHATRVARVAQRIRHPLSSRKQKRERCKGCGKSYKLYWAGPWGWLCSNCIVDRRG